MGRKNGGGWPAQIMQKPRLWIMVKLERATVQKIDFFTHASRLEGYWVKAAEPKNWAGGKGERFRELLRNLLMSSWAVRANPINSQSVNSSANSSLWLKWSGLVGGQSSAGEILTEVRNITHWQSAAVQLYREEGGGGGVNSLVEHWMTRGTVYILVRAENVHTHTHTHVMQHAKVQDSCTTGKMERERERWEEEGGGGGEQDNKQSKQTKVRKTHSGT